VRSESEDELCTKVTFGTALESVKVGRCDLSRLEDVIYVP